MIYPLKTLDQLPLFLKGFRKAKGLTQVDMAGRLGITQQGYAHLEANPASATLERLFIVLRLMDVEIGLAQTSVANDKNTASPGSANVNKTSSLTSGNEKRHALAKAHCIAAPTRKKESW